MNTRSDLSIVILIYNEREYIPALCASLLSQTVQPKEFVFVDNSAHHALQDLVHTHAPHARVIHTGTNLDFSRGVNLGIKHTRTSYVLLLNPDMTLEPTMTEALLTDIERDARIGALAPKLLRLESKQGQPIIDSMGITTNRSHRFWNRGEGEVDRGQYDTTEPFGIAGTAILFRREALNDIAQHGGGKTTEFFDEDFVAYKDDIDLSYRLRHRGWKIGIVPSAVAYHQRTAREETGASLFQSRKKKSYRIRGNSLRNHWFCLLKNEPFVNIVLFLPWIVWYELRKFVFVLFCEPSTVRIIPSTLRLLMRMLRKRSAILLSSRISAHELRTFFTRHV